MEKDFSFFSSGVFAGCICLYWLRASTYKGVNYILLACQFSQFKFTIHIYNSHLQVTAQIHIFMKSKLLLREKEAPQTVNKSSLIASILHRGAHILVAFV